jgi:hypothetical protein
MATLQERIREYLGSQADTPAARNIAQQAESGYAQELGKLMGESAMGAAGAVSGRGATTPAEREYLNSVMNQTRQGPGANVPRVGPNPEALREYERARSQGFEGTFSEFEPRFRRIEEIRNRGMDTPAEREFLRQAMPPLDPTMGTPMPAAPIGGGMAQGIPPMAGRGMDTPREREFLSNTMTPAARDQYFQSFEDAGLNLTPGAGLARGLRGIDQAVTNATTAPGNLGENQLRNIAGGQSNVSPYGLGLGQQMYNPMGLLNF